MNETEDSFFDSKGNNYDLVERNQDFARKRAMTTANSLAIILRSKKYNPDSSRTLRILDKDYQATTVVFANSNGQTCKLEISVPLDFAGNIRLWTNNREHKRVWSTIEKINEASPDPYALFLFLAERFDEIDESAYDDIPF
jgi:hypothetical protein